MVPAIIDPGVGREDDPIGSEGWAQRVRLRMQGIVNSVEDKPDELRRYVGLVQKHRAWTLMNKSDGSHFKTWDEFCETRQPWGLGRPWPELRPYIEAVTSKQAVDIATVSPAGTGNRFTVEKTVGVSSTTRDKTLRAIAERAPEEVKELYREGLISQGIAAKTGPKLSKKATEKQIDARNEMQKQVVLALRDVPRERKAIDAKVREVLGQKPPSRVDQALKLVAKMTASELKRLKEVVCQCG